MSEQGQYRCDLNRAVDDAIACQSDLQTAKRELFYLQRDAKNDRLGADCAQKIAHWRQALLEASEASDRAIARLNCLLSNSHCEVQRPAQVDQAVAVK
jgi:hypothetical protein